MDLSPDTGAEALRAYLIQMRERLGLTQRGMAGGLDMALRAYSDLETGKSAVRMIHILAAERLTLRVAALVTDPTVLAKSVESEVRAVAAML